MSLQRQTPTQRQTSIPAPKLRSSEKFTPKARNHSVPIPIQDWNGYLRLHWRMCRIGNRRLVIWQVEGMIKC